MLNLKLLCHLFAHNFIPKRLLYSVIFPMKAISLAKIVRGLNYVEEYGLSIMVFQMGISIFVQVLMRYLFKSAITWLDEIVHIEVIILTFFGASLCVKYGTHISIDAFKKTLKKQYYLKLIDGVNHLIMAVYVSLVLFFGGKIILAMTMHTHYTPTLKIPKHILYILVCIAFILIGIRSIIGCYNAIQTLKIESHKESTI